jgi:DNA-binding transcriptional MerR regulator/methylmalonyl-CoA mutase cobalamin-binding subunit
MDELTANTPASHSISAAERDTGLGKDTLRVWERRYGFPQPGRDALGERTYPPEQIHKLRLIKRLLDRGFRPGKIINCSIEELHRLGADHPGGEQHIAAQRQERPELDTYLELCRTHQVDELRRLLSQSLIRMGMQAFIVELIAPLNRIVGDYWAQGRFAVFEEHLYTEIVQNVLRYAIATVPPPHTPVFAEPRILLTTFPQESHALGLLMAEALFGMEGARCLSLGVQTPVPEIILAADLQKANVVALSFSSSLNGKQVLEGLQQLAAELAPGTEIWVGGENPALARCTLENVLRLDLLGIPAAIEAWHTRHFSVPAGAALPK